MAFSAPVNSATHREEVTVGFSHCAGDCPGVHTAERRTDLLGSVPCLLLPGAECRLGSRSQKMLFLAGKMHVDTVDHRRVRMSHEFCKGDGINSVENCVRPVSMTKVVRASIVGKPHLLPEASHLEPDCIGGPFSPFLFSRPLASLCCLPPRVTIHQPVCLRNQGFDVRGMTRASDQKTRWKETRLG
jgi:hypothetical protein